MSRQQYQKSDFDYESKKRNKEEFDFKLNSAISEIELKLPQQWEVIMGYIRSLTLPTDLDPREIETVQAAYHSKAAISRLVRRLSRLERGEDNDRRK